jgi:prepilin-type N-terminal cleavage/methylation domain-containing protein
MLIHAGQIRIRIACRATRRAFTLAEVMVSVVILSLVVAGVCYGYSQANRIAAWCSMSQAAQAFAIRGMESARAAKFNPWDLSSCTNTGPDPGGSQMELPPETNGAPSLETNDIMDIPIRGNPLTNYTYYATDYVYVTWYPNATNHQPPVEQILSKCVWTFPLTGKLFTNSIVTLRGPDQ